MSPQVTTTFSRRLATAGTVAAMGIGMATAMPAQQAHAAPSTRPATNNNQVAFNFLVSKGLTRLQAAGVVGNLIQESGSPINPRARQRGGPGMGIAQWSRGARWNQLVAYAHRTHRSEYALATQLDFLWLELNTTERRAFKKLRATRTIPSAAASFSANFERCAPRWCNNGTRAKSGVKVFAAYSR